MSDDQLIPSGVGENVADVAEITEMPVWPTDTDIVLNDRNKMCLLNQKPLVRVILKNAIDRVLSELLFTDSFPNAVVSAKAARRAVAEAAFAYFPGAGTIHSRLMRDRTYMTNMSVIVSVTLLVITSLTY